MDPQIAEFARDAERLIRCAGADTTDALCSISRTQHSFEVAAAGLRDRLQALPDHAPQSAAPVFTPLLQGHKLTRRELSLVWLIVVAAAMVAFALGYAAGRPAPQRLPGVHK